MSNRYWNQKGVTKRIGAETITEEGQEPRKEGGKEITFYSLPVGVLLRLKNTCKEAAPFLAMCFTDTSKDIDTETISSVTEAGTDENGKVGVYPVSEVKVKAISPSTASHRFQQKEKSIAALIDAIFSSDTQGLLVDMIIASASDTFKETDRDLLQNETPLPIFFELLGGVFEASSGAFAGLGEFLPRLLKNNDTLVAGVEKVRSKIAPQA